jgi:hypothetical protein
MTMRALLPLTALLTLLPGTPGGSAAQQPDSDWSGFSFYFENDSFTLGSDGSDDGFTNGLRLQVARDPNAEDAWFDLFDGVPRVMLSPFVDDNRYEATYLVLGQNFFTPRTITVYEPDLDDRPFAGVLFLGVRAEDTESPRQDFAMSNGVANEQVRCRGPAPSGVAPANRICPLRSQSQTQAVFEVSAGVLGPAGGSRILQAGAHVSPSNSRIPKGWHEQIGNYLHLSAFGQLRHRWAWTWASVFGQDVVLDLTPDASVMVGTVQTYLAGGATARLGLNLSGFPTQAGINSASPRDVGRSVFEVGLSAGIAGRLFAHNRFVEGVPGSDPGVVPHREVGDYRLGLFLRAYDWRLDWLYAIRRSPEVRQAGPSGGLYDSYGSIQVSHDPGGVEALFAKIGDWQVFGGRVGSVLRGLYLEAGFGKELYEAGIEEQDEVVRTTAFHAALGAVLPWGFDIGYELTGVGREFASGQDPQDEHLDRFLNQRGFVVGWAPPLPVARSRFGQLRLRAGPLGTAEELEVTPNSAGARSGPCPAGMAPRPEDAGLPPDQVRYCSVEATASGWTFGVGYTLNFGHDAGINVEVSTHDIGLDDVFDFESVTVGMRWTPRFGS